LAFMLGRARWAWFFILPTEKYLHTEMSQQDFPVLASTGITPPLSIPDAHSPVIGLWAFLVISFLTDWELHRRNRSVWIQIE